MDANEGTVDTTDLIRVCGQAYGQLPVPSRENYTFDGWFTEVEGGAKAEEDSLVEDAEELTLYAHWTPDLFTLYFDANGGETDSESKTVFIGCAVGELPVPTRDYYTFDGWFTEANSGDVVTADTVLDNTEDTTVYAHWQVCPYTVTWSDGSGYSVSVSRTSSPYGEASIGELSDGDTIYYGDTLNSISSHGSTTISVIDNITTDDIYATASANSYTYTINYVSANGTNLGSSSATYKFGTTNTISAPAKSGYVTPDPQTIVWDSTDKTITFTYPVAYVSYTTKSGTASTNPTITYGATVEYRNRTANSVQVRVSWTDTIAANGYNIYGQQLRVTCGSTTKYTTVAAFRTWQYSSSSARSSTGTTDWITVSLSTTNQTSASVAVYHYQTNTNGTDMISYGCDTVSATWSVAIPAY